MLSAPEEYEPLRAWLADLWKAGETSWTPEARAVFGELGLGNGAARRQLLESETFRALLGRNEPLPRAA